MNPACSLSSKSSGNHEIILTGKLNIILENADSLELYFIFIAEVVIRKDYVLHDRPTTFLRKICVLFSPMVNFPVHLNAGKIIVIPIMSRQNAQLTHVYHFFPPPVLDKQDLNIWTGHQSRLISKVYCFESNNYPKLAILLANSFKTSDFHWNTNNISNGDFVWYVFCNS